jgi:uncharacterized protein
MGPTILRQREQPVLSPGDAMSATITSLAELEALYGEINPVSLRKELPRLTPEYRRMVEAAPFCAVATTGPGGLDCSPRGDGPGFVHVLDERTVALPDRRGNNRLDTLRNVVVDPKIALLFMIPGVNETLRINGRAVLSVAPDLIGRFAVAGTLPKSVIVVSIDSVYFQCARALIRSGLWDPATRVERHTLPTAGQMTKAADASFDADSYDAALAERQKATLY